jgi:hypothetical protein
LLGILDFPYISDSQIRIDSVHHGIRYYSLVELPAAFRQPTACPSSHVRYCDVPSNQTKLKIVVEDIWKKLKESGYTW